MGCTVIIACTRPRGYRSWADKNSGEVGYDFFVEAVWKQPVPTLTFHPELSSHAHARERFAAAADLEARLKRVVRGEVRFDAGSRALYATDSSNYRQVPIGLVVPLDDN